MDMTREIINTNPREYANPISRLFFTYTIKLFMKGYSKPLDLDDLYNPLSGDRSCKLGDRLEIKWKAHLKNTKNPNLLRVLLQTFSPEFIFLGFLLGGAELVFRIIQPLMLGQFLDYFRPETTKTKDQALFYAGAVVIINGIIALMINQYMLEGCHTGIKIRASFCSVIYRKALKLSRTSLSHLVTGKVVNLLSNDVSRFEYFSFLFHHLWVGPTSGIIIICVLWQQAGFAGLVGVVPILLITPLQSYIGKLSSYFRRQTAYKTDERIRLMDEIISGVQVIKMYAWEKPFEKIIRYARALELKVVTKLSFTRALFLTFNVFTTRIALFSALLTIVLTDKPLTAGKVFVFVCYYNILSYNMSTMFVRAVTDTAEILVSVKRMQDFLLYEEQDDMKFLNDANSKHAVRLSEVTSRWDSTNKEVVLNNINLDVQHGDLLGVIGLVGCGKSSFLQTLLGELCVSGDIEINGTLSYASQEAWVFAATIRQNILFGQKYEPRRYNKVLQVCALESDLKQLINGDLTLIGDRGMTLSGGQKTRVNLARAIYREADIYLLDDPLSAVDVPVAKHIYDKCINGFLANKTRILVTHQVYHLKNANNLIILNNGEIEMKGSFNDLASSEHFYAQVLTEEPEKVEEVVSNRLPNLSSKMGRIESGASIKSELSTTESANQDKTEADPLHELKEMQEKSSKGAVKGNLFLTYLSYGGNYYLVALVLGLYLLTQINVCMVDYFVSYWIKLKESNHPNSNTVLKIYGGLVASVFGIAIIRSLLFFVIAMKSSKQLHNSMFTAVINSKMSFFDTNPSGRILNRFSKDISSVDEPLPKAVSDSGQILLMMVGSIVLVVIVKPYFILPIAIVSFLFAFLRMIFLKSSKNIKRVEGITRSPVFTHLSSTLQGITTVRALKAQAILQKEFEKYQDLYTSATFMFFTVNYAFGFALDVLTFFFTTSVTFSFLLFEQNESGGDVGLAVTQAAALTGMLQWGVRQSAEAVNQLMAAERVLEYIQIPPEKQPVTPIQPSEKWPMGGKIAFKSVGLRYADNKPLVIKNLNVEINPSEKIGIVGRTGAGKSSIATALLRMAIVEGNIEIDGIDTADINLQYLRSKISIIPQDPVLFSGTLRYNLDPFGEYPDHILYKALEEVELKDPTNVINDLDYQVSARGSNYSVGQRQLICLARAIIRNNKILLLDEATANVDPQTDAVIQKTIREKFVNCTVLTIAHRLNTIIDSDRVLVMDCGTMVELGHAHELLQNEDGLFYKMVFDTGSSMMEQLEEIAKQDFKHKNLE